MSSVLLLLLAILSEEFGGLALAGHDSAFCEITSPGQGALPQMPRVFTAHMRSRREGIPDKVSSVEYFDADRQKLSMQTVLGGSQHRIVLDFVNNQGLLINMTNTGDLLGACEVQPINASEFMASVTFKGAQFGVPSKLFFGGEGVQVQSKGQTSIDGLTVKEFYSCHYWKEQDTSLQIHWYFATTSRTKPVRVKLEVKDNTQGFQFALINDVILFTDSLPTLLELDDPFMAPPGLHCRGLSSGGRSPPTPFEQFGIRVERISPEGSEVENFEELYDFRANLSLLIGQPPRASEDRVKYGEGRLMYVHDFQRGVSHVINLHRGNCTTSSLLNAGWDSQLDALGLRMRSPWEFFDLEGDSVQFKGVSSMRNLPADVFITYKRIATQVAGISLNTTLEWHFANKTITDPNTMEKSKISSYPMSVLVSSEATWLNSRMHIYDFDQHDGHFNRRELSACFHLNSRLHFWLFFPLSDRHQVLVRSQTQQFSFRLLPILSLALEISPLRILEPEVAVSDQGATVELTITDKPNLQTNIPETPLGDVKNLLELRVSQEQIFTAVQDGQDLSMVTASKVGLMHERSMNIKSTGYSPGVIAGVSIGLLLAGLLAGLTAAFLYFR